MAIICPLFSGSNGNCIYIGDSKTSFLIDIGSSARKVENFLLKHNLDPNNISSIFITHEHHDHVSGLKVFVKKYNTKVYASRGTINFLLNKGILDKDKSNYKIIFNEMVLEHAIVSCFPTSHDCEEGLGYCVKLKSSGLKISICSDLGEFSGEVFNSIKGSDVVFIESNYDIDMLKNGSYPYYLKKRILSSKGHLSNKDCSAVLPKLIRSGTTRLVLSHLSEENNTEKIAYETAVDYLSDFGMIANVDYILNVAPRFNYGEFKVVL
ncbi:MAG: MBL fold metallo-hydrolase [Oscillospiraceae bacterium]|nr:MBL fold metallo-hydrolase [Oscillospiraceae bacterium]